MNIVDFERTKISLRADIRAEKARHESAMSALRTSLITAEAGSNIAAAGLDDGKITTAKTVLTVYGRFVDGGEERESVIEDAIADLLAGGVKLRHQGFGTKSYGRWHGQRSDHTYGYGPKHGSTIFQVGLAKEFRADEYSAKDTHVSLTDEQLSAAIYCLRNLTRIQAAELTAKQTAEAT